MYPLHFQKKGGVYDKGQLSLNTQAKITNQRHTWSSAGKIMQGKHNQCIYLQ